MSKKDIYARNILAGVYNSVFKPRLGFKNQRMVGALKEVRLTFNTSSNQAYCFVETPKIFRIHLGGRLIQDIVKMPDQLKTKKDYLPYREGLVKAFYALDLHEMGHILFTDMSDKIIVEYPKPQFRNFLHSLFNLIEDPIQEVCMTNWFKTRFPGERSPKVYFSYLIKQIFLPQCEKYKDDKSIGSFMNYLLLMMRCGKKNIPEHNAVWDKYEADLMPRIKEIVFDGNGTQRLHKCVALGEWIIENIKEFDFSAVEEVPEKKRISGSAKSSDGPMHGSTSGSSDPTASASAGSPSSDSEEEDEGGSKGEKEEDEGKGGEGEGEREEARTVDELADAPDIDDIFNDDFDNEPNHHEWVIAKDKYTYDESVIEDLDHIIEEESGLIYDVSKFLKLFTDRNKARNTPGFTSGKLNIRKAMQNDLRGGADTKLFDRRIKRGKDMDLVVSLVTDNSGSMMGRKSEICCKAALAFGQACEWSGIPFECIAFTKTEDSDYGTSLSIEIKNFDDKMDDQKPFFAINDSDLIHKLESEEYIPTFQGNSEEQNLFYIGNRLKRNPHKNKLMLVFCDGGTTGSRAMLSKVVKQITDDNITIIGVGICSRDVEGMYPECKVFTSTEQLNEELTPYLIDTLEKAVINN